MLEYSSRRLIGEAEVVASIKGKTSSVVGGTLWLRVMEDWSTSTPRPTTGSGVRVRSLGEMGST